MEPQPPHEALSLVLSYLNLLELLSMKEVCRSLRFTVDDDLLLWLDIEIKSPLNLRINNDILLDITSKAQGRLRSLALINCVGITDDGLQRVIQDNLLINKLSVPACTRLTPDGIVRVVKKLTGGSNKHNLRYLRLCGIPNLTKEHLQVLNSCLLQHKSATSSDQSRKHSTIVDYNKQRAQSNNEVEANDNHIDVEICPKCENVSLVYDCPKESCVKKKNENPLRECRGCCICIPRCEGCGECTDQAEDEVQETVCSDVLCLNCWLNLPKCNLCNKPYCPRHADIYGATVTASTGFICDVCMFEYQGI
ncbi:F-box protein SKIP28-like [Papaver somniferum]|uniref:F-box protein SKIP28-like n=1 Tax=Papaver somniferum TaxID=3469 RepID=UPI000E703209|nr:F-box protein SKIP28-like [Papaver somniferum]